MRLHLVLALAVGAAAKDPAHDDQECGEAREEEDRDEEALREISSGDGDWEINRRGLREKESTQSRKIMTFAHLRVSWVRRVLC